MEANCFLAEDVRCALCAAEKQEPFAPAREILHILCQNEEIARRERMPICQDTGMAVVFAEVGQDVHITGNFQEAVNAGVRQGQSYADLLIENNVSYRAMRTTNPQLVPGRLITGMRYCAPPAGTRQLCGTGTQTYTVQPDETLAMVAERFRTTPGRLMQLNPTLLPTDFSSGTIVCVP